MDKNIIQLSDGNTKTDFELLMVFEKDGSSYAALSDINDDEHVVIMHLIMQGEEYFFETVDDEILAQELFVEFVAQWETSGDNE